MVALSRRRFLLGCLSVFGLGAISGIARTNESNDKIIILNNCFLRPEDLNTLDNLNLE
ncbi:MAG: hypothetical protein GJ680_11405 [Alteromonadaceae bacterium]|nr:hypothetical protein [Alteromonadaceae bacterium]